MNNFVDVFGAWSGVQPSPSGALSASGGVIVELLPELFQCRAFSSDLPDREGFRLASILNE